MKKLLLLTLIAFLVNACQPRIVNTSENLNQIFAMSEFDIEIQNWGCFGGGIEHFQVELENDGYIIKSKSTGKSQLISKIKIDSLKNYLKTKIGMNEYGGCTTNEYIRVGTFWNSVDYRHSFCSGIESTMINDLLNYYTLVSSNETNESNNSIE